MCNCKHGAEPESEETAREKVLDELLHQPCVPAYHALIHTFAKAGHFECLPPRPPVHGPTTDYKQFPQFLSVTCHRHP